MRYVALPGEIQNRHFSNVTIPLNMLPALVAKELLGMGRSIFKLKSYRNHF